MKLRTVIPIHLSVISLAFVVWIVCRVQPGSAQTNPPPFILNPLPPPVQTTNTIPLSAGEQLGKDIFFDHTLSQPEGYSCATCHIPQSGFTSPSSAVNINAGPLPGVIPGRAGRRKPQSNSYSTFSPVGPFLLGAEGGTYLGGNFWDGRAPNNAAQAKMPFLDQNEMANLPIGPFPPHAGGYSLLVVGKLKSQSYAPLFQEVFGSDVFDKFSDEQIYNLITAALARYEASAEINPFSSKWDASTNGTPASNSYQFTPSENNGMNLFFGKAQCAQCHSSAGLDVVSQVTQGKEVFTMYCYANIAVPKNPGNPYYNQTNCDSNPEGCNALGLDYIDYGLGANPNPAPDGTLIFNSAPGDIEQFRGLFKAPSLRNVDQRPCPEFVKSYMHNGAFKSLEEVVHFYNKRNIATNAAGDEIAFALYIGAPAGYTAIFPPSEETDNAQNLYGLTPDQADGMDLIRSYSALDGGDPTLVPFNGQVGNLQLTASEEADLVNFLKTLTDGYTSPNPVPPVELASSLTAVTPRLQSGSMILQLTGELGRFYILQTSTNLTDWSAVSTNLLADSFMNLTNQLSPNSQQQFWRAVSLPAR